MGCRKFRGRQYWDDLSGETYLPEELEELVFVFDGQALAIDLNDDNAAAFRAAMAPFVAASRPVSKARVLATLPKRERHLKAVPSPDASDVQPEPQEAPASQKGESVEPLPEAEGTEVPEGTPDALNFSSEHEPQSVDPEPAKPVLALAPPPEWAPYAPARGDDQKSRVFKTRKWATLMGRPAHQTLTIEVFDEWEDFYRDQRWRNIK